MFKFFNVVAAVYFLHNNTNKFLGLQTDPKTKKEVLALFDSKGQAVDFNVVEGNTDSKKSSSSSTPQKRKVRIMHPTKSLSLGKKKGKPTMLPTKKKSKGQQYTLVMLADFSLALKRKKKCVLYDVKTKQFKMGSCKDLTKSSFTIYQETTKSNGNKSSQSKDASMASSASSSHGNKGSEMKKEMEAKKKEEKDLSKNISKVIVQNGRAIEVGEKRMGSHFKIGHQAITIEKETKEVKAPFKFKTDTKDEVEASSCQGMHHPELGEKKKSQKKSKNNHI